MSSLKIISTISPPSCRDVERGRVRHHFDSTLTALRLTTHTLGGQRSQSRRRRNDRLDWKSPGKVKLQYIRASSGAENTCSLRTLFVTALFFAGCPLSPAAEIHLLESRPRRPTNHQFSTSPMAFTETQWIDMRTERLEMLLDKHVVDLKDERSLNSASNSPPARTQSSSTLRWTGHTMTSCCIPLVACRFLTHREHHGTAFALSHVPRRDL